MRVNRGQTHPDPIVHRLPAPKGDREAPLKALRDGSYPVPQPGIKKKREY